MSAIDLVVPWPALLQELSLARTLAEFSAVLEQVTRELCQASQVLYYRLSPAGPDGRSQMFCPARPEQTLSCTEDNLVGCSLLNCEIVSFPEERLAIPVTGRTAVAVPVKLYGRPVGCLLIVEPDQPLSPEELWELGQVVSLVQESVDCKEDLAIYSRTTEALLVRAVEQVHGSGMAGHNGRVASLAVEMAKMMDLSSQIRQRLWRAAQYHDVGLLFLAGQPQSEQIRLHPTAGAEYLAETRVLADLAPMVAAHHERYDGSGFPRGLKGEQVPAETWVLALAEHLEDFRRASRDEAVSTILEKFFAGPARSHLPAAVDALGGLLVAGRLEQLLS